MVKSTVKILKTTRHISVNQSFPLSGVKEKLNGKRPWTGRTFQKTGYPESNRIERYDWYHFLNLSKVIS